MKKLLSFILALLMLTSVASAAFADQDQIEAKYTAAVSKMSESGIVSGFPNGNFAPKDTLTRAQAAKILCTVLEGTAGAEAVTATADFKDVPATHWAAKYIGYCAEKGIVSGVGNGKFHPDNHLTGHAFAKMLLVAFGHKAEADGLTGSDWAANVEKLLKSEGRDYDLTVTGNKLTRQEACQLAYNFTVPAADTSAYEEVKIDLKAEKTLYKTQGRTFMNDTGLVMLWPGNAIDFNAELGGELTLHYTAMDDGYLWVFVDGIRHTRTLLPKAENGAEIVLANIRPGAHTIRIVRDHDLNSKGLESIWQAVSFRGVKSSVKATEQKKLFIEYIGDSITSGKGAMSSAKYKGNDPNHSATHAYSYVSASMLDADYSLVSRGSCGFTKTSSSCPKTMANMYDYINCFAADDKLVKYDFARKPDVVILALGTNDSTKGFKDAALAMIEQIRARNGKDVKIVVQYGMMIQKHAATLEKVAKEAGVYSLKVTQDNTGGAGSSKGTKHPGYKGHAKVAEELVAFLKTIL